ncbi:MAG: superoxide dismutase, Ni [Candidatus Nomurabacteria bacterium]|nr:MAG: superoxide dismutase, Ni [Candidatus Nomurabacteria bacterium]
MKKKIKSIFSKVLFGEEASAHCDGPCGVYDGASAEIAARAAVSMTKKLLELTTPTPQSSPEDKLNYHHTVARYTLIKEEQSEIAKRELLILWTDFFKPEHLDAFPDLHEFIWKLAKQCSYVKQHVDLEAAEKMHADIMKLAEMHHQASHH